MAPDPASRWTPGTIAIWALRLAVAAVFVTQGLDKFSDRPLWIRLFTEIGLGQWFRYVTGGIELAGAALVLVPRATRATVALLGATMLGALLVHVTVIGVGRQTVFVLGIVAALVAIGAHHERAHRPH